MAYLAKLKKRNQNYQNPTAVVRMGVGNSSDVQTQHVANAPEQPIFPKMSKTKRTAQVNKFQKVTFVQNLRKVRTKLLRENKAELGEKVS